MGREIEEVQDSMITEKETHAELDSLTPKPDSSQDFLEKLSSPSKVSVWRTFFRIVSSGIKFHEDLFDVFADTVEARALEIIPQTNRRLAILAKEFQFGDELIFDAETGNFIYADTTSTDAIEKQIVDQASVTSANRVVTYKVAKGSGGQLVKLESAEIISFAAYVDDTIVAGTKVIIISADADFFKVAYTIQYDPLILQADGSLIDDGSFPVQEAINAYIQGLPFNGSFRIVDLTDAIQAARGVKNAVADTIEVRDNDTGYTDIQSINTESYLPFSGHLATVDETGTESTPVYGDIPIIGASAYNPTTLHAVGVFATFEGITYKSNVAIDPPEAFDPTKWDTVSNLTFIVG